MQTSQEAVSYFVDAHDRITRVVGPWDAFALANDGPGACAQAVVGKLLCDFIAGDVSRMFISTMLMSARTLQRSVYRPYRCDSGRLKRFMEMTIIPLENGELEVRHRLLHTEPLRQFQFVPARRVADPSVVRTKRCSMCNKVHVAQGWLDIDDAVQLGTLPDAQAQGPWIFGVCPACLERNGAVL